MLGSTGAGSYQYQLPALLNALVGTKFKIILGFKSSPELNLAMERGEIHGRGGTIVSWGITEASWVKENKIAHMVQTGSGRAGLRRRSADDRARHQPRAQAGADPDLGRLPHRPLDRLDARRSRRSRQGPARRLRQGHEGSRDPEARARQKLDLEPATGEELQKIVKDILATPQHVVSLVNKTITVNEPAKAGGGAKQAK